MRILLTQFTSTVTLIAVSAQSSLNLVIPDMNYVHPKVLTETPVNDSENYATLSQLSLIIMHILQQPVAEAKQWKQYTHHLVCFVCLHPLICTFFQLLRAMKLHNYFFYILLSD